MSAVVADIKGDIHITFSDETIHHAKVIGADRFSDLAVLQVQIYQKTNLFHYQLETLQS